MKRVDGAASVSEEPSEASFMSITCVGGRGGRNWLMFGELRSSQGKDKGDQSLTTEYKGWSPSLQEIHHH